ncbi:hypothetical protein Tco_0176305, partial [Tanacetum coccineum]
IPVIPGVPAEVPIVPADPLVAPKVGAVFVTSPTRVLDLMDYSSSDSYPSEDSLPLALELPLVSPFLCSDDSEADSESEPAERRPKRHEFLPFMMLWFRGGGTGSYLGHSHHQDHPLMTHLHHHLSFPFILLLPYSGFVDGQKRVGPFHARRLAWRRVSHRSSDSHSSPYFTSDSSSLDLSSNISSTHSSGCDASGQTHSGPSTRVASS